MTKTNLEKGLFLTTGIDGNGKIHIGMHCCMQNIFMEPFGWIYEEAMISLGLENL